MRKAIKTFLPMAAIAMLGGIAPAHAQSFPAAGKTITMVVPFAAGGPTDKVAHDFAAALRKQLNDVNIVIENVPGAGGTVGTSKVARADKDGYTLLLNHIGMSTMPSLYRRLAVNVLGDFEFLGIVNDVPMVLVARPSLNVGSYAELSRWIVAQNGEVNLGNAGLGSASHLCGLMYQKASGFSASTISYSGTAPAIADLVSGKIDLLCDQTTNTTQPIKDGKVKPYAVTTAQRLSSDMYRNLPSLAEAGLPGFNVTIWHGVYAPKGTPNEVLEVLNKGLRAALKDPEFIERQTALGAVVLKERDARSTPNGHKEFLASELEKWSVVIRTAGQFAD